MSTTNQPKSENQAIVAIDIGTTKIVAIAGTKKNGEIKVLGYGEAESKGIIRGKVSNYQEVSQSIKEAVEQLKAKINITVKNVFVGISSRNIKGHKITRDVNVSGDYITQDDINEIHKDAQTAFKTIYPGEEVIHLYPQQYYGDETPIPHDSKKIGVMAKNLKCDFYIVAVEKAAIEPFEYVFKETGLTKIKFIIGSVAAAEMVLTPDMQETGAIVIDIGGGTTDIAIYQDSVLKAVSVIPFGGIEITNDIKTAFQISSRQAELIKTKYGKAINVSRNNVNLLALQHNQKIMECDLFNVINARFDEIIGSAAYIIDEIEKGNHNKPSKVYLTGGSANIGLINQVAKFRLGCEAIIGEPWLQNLSEDLKKPQYAVSLGLLKKGLDYVEQMKQQKIERKTNITQTQTQTQPNNNVDNQNKTAKTEPQNSKKSGFLGKFIKKIKDNLMDSDINDEPKK